MNMLYILSVFVCLSAAHSYVDALTVDNTNEEEFIRIARSPTRHKPHWGGFPFGGSGGNGHPSFGGHGNQNVGGHGPPGFGGHGHQSSVNNYITNINNYGPGGHGGPTDHGPGHGPSHGPGHGSSFAGSAAFAGSHGSQAQAAAFAVGPHGAAFSHAESGHKRGGYIDFFDY